MAEVRRRKTESQICEICEICGRNKKEKLKLSLSPVVLAKEK
jgi:hypothetical protein